MPGFNILRRLDPMLSLDIHNTIVPPAPAAFPSPYGHISFLGHGMIGEKSKMSTGPSFIAKMPVKTGGGEVMLQGTCCGYMDIHIGLLTNVLFPLVIGFSSSKSLFVSGTVKVNGANVACAVLVFMNLNLNCFYPVSMPNGVVYAFNTVQAGMTLGDILAGVASGLLQIGVEAALGAIMNLPIGAGIRSSINDIGASIGSRMFIRSIAGNMHITTPLANAVARYCGTSPMLGAVIGNAVAAEAVGPAIGLALDQTPTEDTINSRTSDWIGSDDSDEL